MSLALLLALSQGQIQRLYNEGVLLGPIVKLDCVGPAAVQVSAGGAGSVAVGSIRITFIAE